MLKFYYELLIKKNKFGFHLKLMKESHSKLSENEPENIP